MRSILVKSHAKQGFFFLAPFIVPDRATSYSEIKSTNYRQSSSLRTAIVSPCSERHFSNLASRSLLLPFVGRPRSASSFFNSATFKPHNKFYALLILLGGR